MLVGLADLAWEEVPLQTPLLPCCGPDRKYPPEQVSKDTTGHVRGKPNLVPLLLTTKTRTAEMVSCKRFSTSCAVQHILANHVSLKKPSLPRRGLRKLRGGANCFQLLPAHDFCTDKNEIVALNFSFKKHRYSVQAKAAEHYAEVIYKLLTCVTSEALCTSIRQRQFTSFTGLYMIRTAVRRQSRSVHQNCCSIGSAVASYHLYHRRTSGALRVRSDLPCFSRNTRDCRALV